MTHAVIRLRHGGTFGTQRASWRMSWRANHVPAGHYAACLSGDALCTIVVAHALDAARVVPSNVCGPQRVLVRGRCLVVCVCVCLAGSVRRGMRDACWPACAIEHVIA